MLDCNQNVSCQFPVVKRSFRVVSLIEFCMRSGLPLPQGVDAWIPWWARRVLPLSDANNNVPELCTLATTPMYGTFETSQTFLKFKCSEQHSSTIAIQEP